MGLPVFGLGILFGLAGDTATYFVLIAIGYLGVVSFSLASIYRYKFSLAVLVSIFVITGGVVLNDNFWKAHNANLCYELRNNPTCVEDKCGFTCSDVGGGIGFSTGGSICKDKNMDLCLEK